MTETTGLGYPFVPVPRWVADECASGGITLERLGVLLVLFDRANTSRLAARKPTPQMRLQTLADRLRYQGELDSLNKLVRRMRSDGLLDFDVSGDPHRGYRYEFTLQIDGRRLSDLGPTKAGPTKPALETVRPGGETGGELSAGSNLEVAQNTGGGPTKTADGPTYNDPANTHDNTVSEPVAQQPCPSYSDRREEANPSVKERLHGEESSSHAHAREDDPADQLDVEGSIDEGVDRLLAAAAEAKTQRSPVADAATRARAAQLARRDQAILAGYVGREREVLDALVETFDVHDQDAA